MVTKKDSNIIEKIFNTPENKDLAEILKVLKEIRDILKDK